MENDGILELMLHETDTMASTIMLTESSGKTMVTILLHVLIRPNSNRYCLCYYTTGQTRTSKNAPDCNLKCVLIVP